MRVPVSATGVGGEVPAREGVLPSRAPAPGVAACLIVKDGAESIGRAIASVRPPLVIGEFEWLSLEHALLTGAPHPLDDELEDRQVVVAAESEMTRGVPLATAQAMIDAAIAAGYVVIV